MRYFGEKREIEFLSCILTMYFNYQFMYSNGNEVHFCMIHRYEALIKSPVLGPCMPRRTLLRMKNTKKLF